MLVINNLLDEFVIGYSVLSYVSFNDWKIISKDVNWQNVS